MLFKFALRNVLRNKKRSILTAISILVAAFIITITEGWANGAIGSYINNFVVYQTAHVRVMTDEYHRRERFIPVDEVIYNSSSLIKKIKKIKGVSSVKERIRFGIMLGKGEKTEHALGMGIDLNNNSFKLNKKILKQKVKKLSEDGIYIGKILARRIGVKVGDKLLLAAKTSRGGLNGIKLKVAGIFSMGVMVMDKKVFFISLKNARRLLKLKNRATEIYVFADHHSMSDEIKKKISGILSSGVIALTFKEQIKNFYNYLILIQNIMIFIEAIILFLASFIVINTMMMAIFERLREIGTLKAMGMTDRQLFFNFTLEGGIIGAAGGIVGVILAGILLVILSKTGIDFSDAVKDIDFPIEYVIHPSASFMTFVVTFLMSILIPAFAAMIPARYAKKLMPSEALRKI